MTCSAVNASPEPNIVRFKCSLHPSHWAGEQPKQSGYQAWSGSFSTVIASAKILYWRVSQSPCHDALGMDYVLPARQTDSQGQAGRLSLQGLRRGIVQEEKTLPPEKGKIAVGAELLTVAGRRTTRAYPNTIFDAVLASSTWTNPLTNTSRAVNSAWPPTLTMVPG